MPPDRPYRYYARFTDGSQHWVKATRDEWLDAILGGHNRPKPPMSWVDMQRLEGRSEKSAAIIWGRNYDAGRKYTIWDQATDADFAAGGYM